MVFAERVANQAVVTSAYSNFQGWRWRGFGPEPDILRRLAYCTDRRPPCGDDDFEVAMREHLGQRTDIDIVTALVEIEGRSLLELGCASGATARRLVEGGATVVGIEPDPVQAQRNREAEPVPGLTLTEGRAEALPQGDRCVDGVFFFRSLHHVPSDAMHLALEEAGRVVRPGGFVFVLEPSVEGSHTALMRPFHDEREVRSLAQQALDAAAIHLGERRQYASVQERTYGSFEEMSTRFSSMSFNDFSPEMIDVPAVRESFEAARTNEGYVFEQPILIDVFRVG